MNIAQGQTGEKLFNYDLLFIKSEAEFKELKTASLNCLKPVPIERRLKSQNN